MKLAKLEVLLSILMYVGLGFAFLFFPVEMTAFIDLPLPPGNARIDVQATYGGFLVGFGAFLIWCFLRDEIKTGLLAATFAIAGFASARLFGILTSEDAPQFMKLLFCGELTMTIVQSATLWKLTRPGTHARASKAISGI